MHLQLKATPIVTPKSLMEEINLAVNELNDLISKTQENRDINRIQALFDQLTGKPMPQHLMDLL